MRFLGSPLPPEQGFPSPFCSFTTFSEILGPTEAEQMSLDPLRGPRRAEGVISAGMVFLFMHTSLPPLSSVHTTHRNHQTDCSGLKAQAASHDRVLVRMRAETCAAATVDQKGGSLLSCPTSHFSHWKATECPSIPPLPPQLTCHSSLKGGGTRVQPHPALSFMASELN